MRPRWAATLFLSMSLAQSGSADFTAFYRRFRTALAAGDGTAVASLTALPFMLDGRQLDGVEFARRYGELFDDTVRQCFPFAEPVPDGDAMTVSCSTYVFYFRPINGEYRLVDFAADPESAPNASAASVNFHTSYDIRAEPFRNLWFFGPIAAALLLIVALLYARAIRQEGSPRYALVLLTFTGVGAAVTIGIPYWDRHRLAGHLANGRALTAEGRVAGHEEQEVRVAESGKGSRSTTRIWEAFAVNGVQFGFYREVEQAGFHNSAGQRQEIRDGMLVRVHFVDDKPDNVMERRIVRIEKATR